MVNIFLAGQIIEPCKACWACGEKGNCVHRKDMFQEIFDKIKAAVVADMNPGLLKHKVGGSVVAARRGGALTVVDTMNHFFLNHEMFVVESTYWNMAYGQMPGDVLKDEEGLNNIKNLGENMVFLLKQLNLDK